MKKIAILVLCYFGINTLTMEKNIPEQFPFQELLPELKVEVLIHQTVSDTKNVLEAIENFKKLRLVSKQFATKDIMWKFLDIANEKFPGQEVRVARLLNNDYAAQWLKNKVPNLKSYSPIPNDSEIPYEFVRKDNLQALEQWLLKGYLNGTLGKTGKICKGPFYEALYLGRLDVIKLFIKYGQDVNALLFGDEDDDTYSVLSFSEKHGYREEITDYLENEGAIRIHKKHIKRNL